MKRRAQPFAEAPLIVPKRSLAEWSEVVAAGARPQGRLFIPDRLSPMCSPNPALRISAQNIAGHSSDSVAECSTAASTIGGLAVREFEVRRCQDDEADAAEGDGGSR